MRRKRLSQVIKFGWKDAKEIAALEGVKKSRLALFFDILSCFKKYYIFSNQYKNLKVWNLSEQERISLSETIGNKNRKRDQWVDSYYENWKFLNKYTSLSWQETPEKFEKRNEAYRIRYGLGKNVSIQYGVTFICEHFSIGKITCGNNVLFARNVDIDYTGDLTIEDDVKISEGVKILTHNHDLYRSVLGDYERKSELTPLIIQDNVWIGARAFIQPGVGLIGRGAVIGTGSVVKHTVPPYAVVVGNPAKIVGFSCTPEEVESFEKDKYPETKKTDIEKYKKTYDKYFVNRISDIKKFLNN